MHIYVALPTNNFIITIIYHCASWSMIYPWHSIIPFPCLLLPTIIYAYLSLSIITRHYWLSSLSTHHFPSSSMLIYQDPLLHILVYHCPPFSTVSVTLHLYVQKCYFHRLRIYCVVLYGFVIPHTRIWPCNSVEKWSKFAQVCHDSGHCRTSGPNPYTAQQGKSLTTSRPPRTCLWSLVACSLKEMGIE